MGKPQLVTITEPPTRSPARERLAAAVDRHKSAVELLSRIKTAHELAEETAYVASDKLTAAEAALAEATANEVDHLVSIALGSADVAPSPSKTASDAVERAKNDLSIARATRAALEARQTVTAGEIEKSRYALDDAVKAVLQSETSACVTDLLRKAEEMQRELINARVRLRFLLHSDGIAEPLAGQDGEKT